MLDLLYTKTKKAYSSSPLPLLGHSVHNLVHLFPVYTPMVTFTHKKIVRKWTEEHSDQLRDCFSMSEWDMLCVPCGEYLDDLTHCITDYINVCVENTVLTWIVQCFSNNKPWVTPEMEVLLREKKRVFRFEEEVMQKRIQRDLQMRIEEGMDAYRRKVEGRLQQENMKKVFRGLK